MRSGPPEARENLVEDEEEVVAVGGFAQAAQDRGVVEQHAARALDQRLDQNAREFVGVPLQHALERRRALLVARQIDQDMLGQEAGKTAGACPPRDRTPPSSPSCRRGSRPGRRRTGSGRARRGSANTGPPSSWRPRPRPSPTRRRTRGRGRPAAGLPAAAPACRPARGRARRT